MTLSAPQSLIAASVGWGLPAWLDRGLQTSLGNRLAKWGDHDLPSVRGQYAHRWHHRAVVLAAPNGRGRFTAGPESVGTD